MTNFWERFVRNYSTEPIILGCEPCNCSFLKSRDCGHIYPANYFGM